MSTLGLCAAARWRESQLIKSNMFTEGENVWMEAGVEMTAPRWEKTNVTRLGMNRETCCFVLLSKVPDVVFGTSADYSMNEAR